MDASTCSGSLVPVKGTTAKRSLGFRIFLVLLLASQVKPRSQEGLFAFHRETERIYGTMSRVSELKCLISTPNCSKGGKHDASISQFLILWRKSGKHFTRLIVSSNL